jgi:hypothetical protein
METYIKITPDTLIEMCDKKISFLERLEEEAIEIHIANNIKPERKKLFSSDSLPALSGEASCFIAVARMS